MKNSLFIILLISLIVFATSCTSNTINSKSNKNYQTITTKSFTLLIPKEWSVEISNNILLKFKNKNNKIGSLDLISYEKNENINSVLPNHTEVISINKLKGFFTDTYEVKLVASQPAASGNLSKINQTHILFLLESQKVAYDLSFNTDDIVDEQTILNIANSFKLK